jgi:hypothetical protein
MNLFSRQVIVAKILTQQFPILVEDQMSLNQKYLLAKNIVDVLLL